MHGIEPVLDKMCPNCGGPISAERLERGLPCKRCLPSDNYYTVEEIGKALEARGTLLNYAWVYALEKEYEKFRIFFAKKTKSELWSAQKSWAKRLLLLDSMAIIAPTGVGKTTLLSVYAVYRAELQGWKVLYLVPTQNLVTQTASKIMNMVDNDIVVYYTGSMSKKLREEALNRIANGEYKILVVTTSFLQRNFDLLEKNAPFNLIIVDDVDSLLRSGKNVDRVLKLMGYKEDHIQTAEKLVKTKLRFYQALSAGQEKKIDELQREIAELEGELRLFEDTPMSQLVIASATGRPRGIKHLLFKELLGFEVGGGSDYMRSVDDTYLVTTDLAKDLVRIVKTLGRGGVVFVSQLHGKPLAKLLVEKLKSAGIKAELALAGTRRAVNKLASGEADVIVGVASRYGVIVRGLDLPETIKYAVFIEIPARRISLEDALSSAKRQLALLFYINEKGGEKAQDYIKKITRLLEKIPDPRIVALAYNNKIDAEGLLLELVEVMKESAGYIKEWFESSLAAGERVRLGGILVEKDQTGTYLVTPDAPTYIQASGRTSRLYKGVMTHGLSIVLTKDRQYVEALEERLKWYTSSIFREFDSLDINNVLTRIAESRQGKGKKINVKTVLLIVESPTKARTIAWFWGRPSKRRFGRLTVYETSTVDPDTGTVYLLMVTATRGHFLELAIDVEDSVYGVKYEDGVYKPVYKTIKRCLECGYTYAADGACPRCGSYAVYSAASIVDTLRKLSLEVDEIIIATDPDREGEKIAWDVYLVLKPFNSNIRRGRFHEVTRDAIIEALRGATSIDHRLVYSQIVRRIEDRWIGFTLSKHLWSKYNKRWLGAGRVQTPVLGWIVSRYEEWKQNKGYLLVYNYSATGERIYLFVKEKEKAKELSKDVEARISSFQEWIEEVNPAPPYTTDALLYDASLKLGYSASFTMKLAQELFEAGLITYHRTDSTRISTNGMGIAKSYLEKKGLEEHYYPRSWGEGGAHEAIRPTKPLDVEELQRLVLEGTLKIQIKLTRAHLKLYDLIFKRFIASQMKPSKAKKASIELEFPQNIVSVYEGIIDYEQKGHYLMNPPRTRKWIKEASAKDSIKLTFMKKVRTSSIRLFKTGDLVRLMKEKKIGRPSTYAKVIESNRRHGYIIISKKAQYVVPTKTGITVFKYLNENFPVFVSEETSRELEEILDKIESGEMNPVEAINDLAIKLASVLPDSQLAVLVDETGINKGIAYGID
ncbi:MAG: reverse gyrase [Desulfurococcales archaeon]|nr:reverse gyrase [Desulfurococcales archaeon]